MAGKFTSSLPTSLPLSVDLLMLHSQRCLLPCHKGLLSLEETSTMLSPRIWTVWGPPGLRTRWVGGLGGWEEGLGLCDVWGIWNPLTRGYTHTSAAHGSHSRIDYIFLPASEVSCVSAISLLPHGISDHAPVSARIGSETGAAPRRERV